MPLMMRSWRKYTAIAALSCSLFFLIVTMLFLSVMHLEGPSLSKNDVITADITMLTAGVINSIQAGRVGPAHLHSTHRQMNSTSDQSLYAGTLDTHAWLVVVEGGLEVTPVASGHKEAVDLHLSSAIIILGSTLDVVWTHEGEIDLKLLVEYPVSGWATIAHANIATGEVEHYIRLLNTTIVLPEAATEPASHCTNVSAQLVHMDFKGGDLRGSPSAPVTNPVTVNSAAECCARCSATPSCLHWTMVGGGECWLKGQSATLVPGDPGDPAKQLISGSIAPQSSDASQSSAQRGAEPVQGPTTVAAEVTTSVRCCSVTKADSTPPTLSTLAPDSLAEILSALTVPRFDKHCNSVLDPGRCAITGRAPLPRAMATVVAQLLTQPATLADRSQALHSGRIGTVLVDPTVVQEALREQSVRFQARQNDGANQPEPVTMQPVLQTNRLRADWTDQQPIGTGRFGALVGGNLRSEIVPVSVAGLFFKHSERAAPKQYNDTNFRSARADLRAGQYEAADKKMSSYIKQNLGMFQYVADLAIVYSPTPIVWAEKPPSSTEAKGLHPETKGGHGAAPPRRNIPRHRPAGRLGLLRSLNERLNYRSPRHSVPGQSPPAAAQTQLKPEEIVHQRPPFGDVLVSDGILDMQRGVAHSQIVERPAVSGSTSRDTPRGGGRQSSLLRYHHREWFASAVDGVIVGTMACNSQTEDGSGSGEAEPQSCLNMALELSREYDPRLIPLTHFRARPLTLTPAQQRKWLPTSQFTANPSSVEAAQFEMQLTSSPAATLPDTVLSGVILCVGQSGRAELQLHTKEDGLSVVLCNEAERVHVVLTVESNGKTYTAADADIGMDDLARKANQRIQSALSKGLAVLRADHTRDFAEKMNRVDLRFDSGLEEELTPRQETCFDNPVEHRLESFQDGCVASGQTDKQSVKILTVPQKPGLMDTALVAQLFQYGRYLLLSSATGAVANLQGLWADGPTSAWNGDYHLNINLQMAYWAADTVSLPETLVPLRGFIQKLSKTGRGVAREMYGCQDLRAWTAHGFVDADLDGFPYGDNQWALCVTCGAWTALSIWEHLVTRPFDVAVLMKVVGTLRGVALFFQEYMWEERPQSGEGAAVMHTGPTTSPENSYVVLLGGPTQEEPSTARVLMAHLPPPPPPPGGEEQGLPPPPKLVPFRPPATTEHHSVRQLTFSPTLDVSVLTQASKAYSLAVRWGLELSAQCKGQVARCLETDPALTGLTEAEVTAFFAELQDDKRTAAAFHKTVAAMVSITIDTTLHDTSHSLTEHLHRVASAQNPATAAAPPQQHPPSPGGERAGMHAGVSAEREDFCRRERGGCVREYHPYLPDSADPNPPPLGVLSETLDIGHRHFSALHWVYPNSFLPPEPTTDAAPAAAAEYVEKLYRGASNTLAAKRAHGGGHTGWSATWEAALWARLRSSEDAFGAIAKLIGTFIAPNLLALHPPLDPLPGPVECSTCFGESVGIKMQRRRIKEYHINELRQKRSAQSGPGARQGYEPLMTAMQLSTVEEVLLTHRGMVTGDQSKIDANLGYLAAVTEMLLQSHLPGFLYLLPALPQALSSGGQVRGLLARGGVRVSLCWHRGRVRAARLVFNGRHPYSATVEVGLGVTSPNPLHIASVAPSATGLPACPAQSVQAGSDSAVSRLHTFRLNGPDHKLLQVAGPPLTNCVLSLCDAVISESECNAALRRIM